MDYYLRCVMLIVISRAYSAYCLLLVIAMYGKLFASLYQGTLRGQSDAILVFTNLIACADSVGFCDKHPRAIADETGLSIDRVEAAIATLMAADPDSRSPENDGKRLVFIDEHRNWGWIIVNHGKYRSIKDEADRREQNRLAQERWRNKNKHPSADVSIDKQASAGISTVSPNKPKQKQKQKQKKEEEADKPPISDSVRDEWVIPQMVDTQEVRNLLAKFAAMRLAIRKPIKSLVDASLILRQFDDADHLQYALEVCISNQYQGLKPDYKPSGKKQSGISSRLPPDPALKAEMSRAAKIRAAKMASVGVTRNTERQIEDQRRRVVNTLASNNGEES